MKNNLKFLCTSSAACAALVAGHDRPTLVSPHIALVIRVEALEALPSNCGLRAALVWHNIGSFFITFVTTTHTPHDDNSVARASNQNE